MVWKRSPGIGGSLPCERRGRLRGRLREVETFAEEVDADEDVVFVAAEVAQEIRVQELSLIEDGQHISELRSAAKSHSRLTTRGMCIKMGLSALFGTMPKMVAGSGSAWSSM